MQKREAHLLTFARVFLRLLVAFIATLPFHSCAPLSNDPADMVYVCGTSDDLAFRVVDDHVANGRGEICGEGDENLPAEPRMPEDVCATLVAEKRLPADSELPDEDPLDTDRIQEAFNRCEGLGAVKLVKGEGNKAAFVSGPLILTSTILWIDEGVTLFQSRNAELFQKTGNCGKLGVNDSDACHEFIQVNGTSPGIVGDGTIDGQGGEPLLGEDYSFWEMSEALRSINGSIGNPQMVNLKSGVTGFLMYRIHLQNASKSRSRRTRQTAPATKLVKATPSGGSPCSRLPSCTTRKADS